jgi:hypothetical protein
MKKYIFAITATCIVFLVDLYAQSPALPYGVFVELKAGFHRERNLLTYPGGRLNSAPHIEPTFGVNEVIYLKDGKSALTVELDIVTIENSFIFDSVPGTGNTLTHSLAMGYTFGKTQQRKEQIEKKKQLYTPEEWEKRKRWSLVLHTSNTYPVVNLSDPAGYLTKEPVERFTYGAQVFYRITPKWSIGTGFESVPFQLDARTPEQIGGSGTYVRNSIQFPLLAEYALLHTKGKIKIEWLARGGLAIGLQRKFIADPQTDFGELILTQSQFYWERETKDRPSCAFLAGVLGTRVNLHLSKSIFLTGYLQNQWAITNSAFHRSRAIYQVGSPQAPLHEAELTTKGSVLLPGFGVGFQL